jgi:L-alanine-DL-glutamate epimerase-like enolase superfamily enzyme
MMNSKLMTNYRLHKTRLYFKYPFVISHGTRHYTESLFFELHLTINAQKITGWGEATMPPYLKENCESVASFIESFNWDNLNSEQSVLERLEEIKSQNDVPCGRTIIEMCLIDLLSKSKNLNFRQYLNLPKVMPAKYCSYTLSLSDSHEEILKKLEIAKEFNIYKIKLTHEDDLQKISNLKILENKKFMVDANQCFRDSSSALRVIDKLYDLGCVAVEQPLQKELWEQSLILKLKSPIPIIADESFQSGIDLPRIMESFHGINIKTLKVGGVLPALEVIKTANENNLLIQIGCMSESSLGCTYALALIDHASYIDIDGPLLIKNDPFTGIRYDSNGKIIMSTQSGIGVKYKGKFNLEETPI